MTRIGYDSVDVNGIPADATLMFGYINGKPEWRSYAPMKERFPNATVGSISVDPSVPAHILDIENGDALPEQAPAWVDLSKAAGFTDPCCYMAMGTWGAVQNAFVGKADPLYWVADRGQPFMVRGAIANQWLNTPGYDQSIVADYWPGLDPIPDPPMEENMVVKIVGTTGSSNEGDAGAAYYLVNFDEQTYKHLNGEQVASLQVWYGAPIESQGPTLLQGFTYKP